MKTPMEPRHTTRIMQKQRPVADDFGCWSPGKKLYTSTAARVMRPNATVDVAHFCF